MEVTFSCAVSQTSPSTTEHGHSVASGKKRPQPHSDLALRQPTAKHLCAWARSLLAVQLAKAQDMDERVGAPEVCRTAVRFEEARPERREQCAGRGCEEVGAGQHDSSVKGFELQCRFDCHCKLPVKTSTCSRHKEIRTIHNKLWCARHRHTVSSKH